MDLQSSGRYLDIRSSPHPTLCTNHLAPALSPEPKPAVSLTRTMLLEIARNQVPDCLQLLVNLVATYAEVKTVSDLPPHFAATNEEVKPAPDLPAELLRFIVDYAATDEKGNRMDR